MAVAAHRVEEVAELMKGQYRLALERGYYTWVKEFRVRLDHIMDKRYIDHYFPSPDGSRRQAGERPYLPSHSRLYPDCTPAYPQSPRRGQAAHRPSRGNSRRGRNRRAGTPVSGTRATPDRTAAYPQSPRRGQAAHRPSRGSRTQRGASQDRLYHTDSPAPGSYDRSTAQGRSPRCKRRSATPDRRRDPQEARRGRAAHQVRRVSSILRGPSSAASFQGRSVRFQEWNGDENLHQFAARERRAPRYRNTCQHCPVCRRRNRNMRIHVLRAHLPTCSHHRFTNFAECRVKALEDLARRVLGRRATLSDLVQEYDLVSRVSDGHMVDESVVLQDIRQVARELGEDTPG